MKATHYIEMKVVALFVFLGFTYFFSSVLKYKSLAQHRHKYIYRRDSRIYFV